MNDKPITSQTPPASPRPGRIDARTLTREVIADEAPSPRVSKHLDSVKKDFFSRLWEYVYQPDPQDLRTKLGEVEKDLNQLGIQPRIKEQQVDEFGSWHPHSLSEEEVDGLKELAHKQEQKVEFLKELNSKPGVVFEGSLLDVFDNKEPTEKDLLTYGDTLKKLFARKECLPSFVTESPSLGTFKFFFDDKPVVITLKTKQDVIDLETNLKRCNNDLPGKYPLNTNDPFSVKEGYAKRTILQGLAVLSDDKRTMEDKIWGFFRRETPHVKQLKLDNQEALTNLKIDFNRTVKGSSFGDVVKKMSQDVQDKLAVGELLTDAEVGELQAKTRMAMQRQRYIDDLQSSIPARIEGNLKTEFNGIMPEKAVFEKYLHKLKESLIKGRYPNMVTSHLDVHKFVFFILPGGQHKEITVNSLEDLDRLEGFLNRCVDDAESFIPEDKKPENVITALQDKLAAAQTAVKENEGLREKLEANVEAERKKSEATAAELEKVKAEKKKVDEVVSKQANVIKGAEETIVGQGKEIQNLKDQNVDFEEYKELADKENEELKNQLENMKSQQVTIAGLNAEIQAQIAEVEAQKQALEAGKKNIEEQNAHLKELEATAEEIQKNYVTYMLIGSMIGFNAEAKAEIAKQSGESIEEVQERVARYEKYLQELMANNAKLETELERADELEDTVTALRKMVEDNGKVNTLNEAKIREQSRRIEELERQQRGGQ